MLLHVCVYRASGDLFRRFVPSCRVAGRLAFQGPSRSRLLLPNQQKSQKRPKKKRHKRPPFRPGTLPEKEKQGKVWRLSQDSRLWAFGLAVWGFRNHAFHFNLNCGFDCSGTVQTCWLARLPGSAHQDIDHDMSSLRQAYSVVRFWNLTFQQCFCNHRGLASSIDDFAQRQCARIDHVSTAQQSGLTSAN